MSRLGVIVIPDSKDPANVVRVVAEVCVELGHYMSAAIDSNARVRAEEATEPGLLLNELQCF